MKKRSDMPATTESPPKRLARIRGQVDGIGRMIENNRDCVDILVQLRAVHAALRKVEEQVLRRHVEYCIAGALEAPGTEASQEKLDELFAVLGRFGG